MSSLWDTHRMEKNLKQYVNKVVRVTWLMAVQEPAMMLHWQDTSDRVKKDLFDFHGRQGDTVSVTVWPAVSAHETGNLISKGFVMVMWFTRFCDDNVKSPHSKESGTRHQHYLFLLFPYDITMKLKNSQLLTDVTKNNNMYNLIHKCVINLTGCERV